LLVEAFLYEQTRRGISIKHWEEFEDVADHLRSAQVPQSPCPVGKTGSVDEHAQSAAQRWAEIVPVRPIDRHVLF
jgi:hypothetical protein